MRTQWARVGRTSTIGCSLKAPNDSNFSLEWRKDGQLIYNSYGHEQGHSAPVLQGRVARDGSLGLTIHAVVKEDEAVYVCSLTRFSRLSTTAATHGAPVKLVVNLAPVIEEPLNAEVVFREPSSQLQLQCIAHAVPTPEISWLRNGRIVSGNAHLSIQNITLEDEGSYSCLAANIEGRAESVIFLRFPKNVTFDFPPQNKTVVEGSSSFWNCHATAFPEEIEYSWTFQGRDVRSTHVGLRAHVVKGELAIRDVRKEDGGEYKCQASNKFHSATASAYLDVQYVPEVRSSNLQVYTVAEGSSATLDCSSDANPPVTLSNWSRNGHFFATKEKDRLELVNISTSDAGLYSCEVYNSLGRGNPFEIHVIVAQPPVFVVKPPPEIYVELGSKLFLECRGFADPLPIQYWVKDKERIASENIEVESVAYEDNEEYECVVSNAVATVRAKTRVFIKNTRPLPATVRSVECVGEAGLNVSFAAGYDGGHQQTLRIHYENEGGTGKEYEVKDNSDSAILTDLEPFGKYRITLESTNALGSAMSKNLEKHVCTRLAAPEDPHLEMDRIVWQEVGGAHSYRVEMKPHKSTEQFIEVAEVLSPEINVDMLGHTSDLDIRVLGLRPPFPPGPPSRTLTLSYKQYPSDRSFMFALCGGALLFLIFFVVYLYARSQSQKRKKKKLGVPSPPSLNQFGSLSKRSPQREFFEPSYSRNVEEEDLGQSHSSSRERVIRELRSIRECTDSDFILYPYGSQELNIERESVVDDMFRHKYILTPEDAQAALLDELRIQRLKREFHQSHL